MNKTPELINVSFAPVLGAPIGGPKIPWCLKLAENHLGCQPSQVCSKGSNQGLLAGKHTKNYGKSPFSMGKSTISMAIFNSKLLVDQRVLEGTQGKNT